MGVAVPYAEVMFNPGALTELKDQGVRALKEQMRARGFATRDSEITLKHIRANDDLEIANGTDTNEYTLAAGVAGTDTLLVDSVLVDGNKFHVFTGVSIRGAFVRLPIITVRFKVGPGGANTVAEYDLQGGADYDNKVWFFSDPPVYKPDDRITIELENAVTYAANTLQLTLKGYTTEPSGTSEG